MPRQTKRKPKQKNTNIYYWAYEKKEKNSPTLLRGSSWFKVVTCWDQHGIKKNRKRVRTSELSYLDVIN